MNYRAQSRAFLRLDNASADGGVLGGGTESPEQYQRSEAILCTGLAPGEGEMKRVSECVSEKH